MLLNLRIIVVGKIKETYYRNKAEEYLHSINKHHSIDIIELSDESIPKNAGNTIINSIKECEGKKILDNIQSTDYVIALCIDGKMVSSDNLKNVIDKAESRCLSRVVFIIGGSLGLSDSLIRRADYKLSFSAMTFPHQLMRVMLLEQLANYL